MLVDDPKKSIKFNKDREKYGFFILLKLGSYFCFHGSGIENWHSILRTGLINASNTKVFFYFNLVNDHWGCLWYFNYFIIN
jgi:hypothetical protein